MDPSGGVYGVNNLNNRTSGSFIKRRPEDNDGRGSIMEECDSTTEPVNQKMQNFHIGEDVYYQEESGQKNVLGTVALVQGKKVKIIFLDETEQWAHISKVKKISFQLNNDSNANAAVEEKHHGSGSAVVSGGSVVTGSKKKAKGEMNGQITPKESLQVTCGSCGTHKMIAAKKAVEFSPYTTHQYNCRKCINKSKTNKNNGVPLPLTAHYLAAATRGRPKGSDNGAISTAKGMLDHGITNGVIRRDSDICLHCRSQIVEKISLRCTMCERPCHPSCLALTPPPLPGDTFWSIICHACGTQKPDGSPENDSQKVYSSRRSISSWSDVAFLLLSCLGCKHPNEKYFELDEQVIPFWEENVPRLHLPRQYKNTEPTERKKLLLTALNNASLRFSKDEQQRLWGIKDHFDSKGLNMLLKPSGGRGVTAAGFPIQNRAVNTEATTKSMTNIAQTIAVANKANSQGVPTPKNSPSLIASKPNLVAKLAAGVHGAMATPGRKKLPDNAPVAKKTAHTPQFPVVNSGIQRQKPNDIWAQARFQKTMHLPELPKSTSSAAGHISPDEIPSAKSNQLSNMSANRVHNGQNTNFKTQILSASPGGAARVTGMVISSNSSTSPPTANTDVTNKTNCGSYPVRKNGSPMLNRSIRVEPVIKKGEGEPHNVKPYRFEEDGNRKEQEFIRESPGFNNTSNQKLPVKRKLSPGKLIEGSGSFSKVLDGHAVSQEAKKLKMALPNSTDITSQRVPSPTKPPDMDATVKGQKKAMSPLQKLSDLQKNGGLTVACLTHTKSGMQTVTINSSSLDDGSVLANGSDSNNIDVLTLSPEKYETLLKTPVKNCSGATTKVVESVKSVGKAGTEEHTKDKTNNVTTSPRVFKHATVSSPGSSKASPTSDRKLMRSARLKRSVVANAQAEKQSKDGNEKPINKKINSKITPTAAAAAALVAKASRGRPKKPFKPQYRKASGMTYSINQFNGPVVPGADESASANNTINELDYTWNSSSIQDLLDYGHGYRLGCLPHCPDRKEEIVQAAVKILKEEVAPRPPSYWSTSSNHSKKPCNQKSKRDLKNVDSYYISGRSIAQNGIQYQIVWRDGYGFEYSSEDEEELGVGLGEENYLHFDDYDHMEYFFDKMPVTVNTLIDDCDSEKSTSNGEEKISFGKKGYIIKDVSGVKKEPEDIANESPRKFGSDNVGMRVPKCVESRASINEPVIIDLTDSP